MSRTDLKKKIREGVFLLDGAMGTQLISRGIEVGKCNEYLNIEAEEVILDIHRQYIKAGSDAILTNTFGANDYVLARHGLADMVGEINAAAVRIARKAAGEGKYVFGDIGPSGGFLKPVGELEPEQLKKAFARQAGALGEAGADAIIIETMTALDEAMAAIEAVKGVCELPVFVSMAFEKAGEDFKTMMGIGVEQAVSKLAPMGIEAVGFNCGTATLSEYVELAGEFVAAAKSLGKKILVFAEPNAGRPQLVENRTVYNVTAEDFAATAKKICSAGVKIIGGCCGTGPEHIEAAVRLLKR